MKKVCHIRCNKEYWKNFNVFEDWKRIKSFPVYSQFNNYWNKLLKISHMSFRKQVRDLVISQIKKTNYFDVILEDNETCYNYLKNNSHEVILFQQDDDDIFIKPFSQKPLPGITYFNYQWIDVLCMRRSTPYGSKNLPKKRYLNNGIINSTQTNQAVINNKNNKINISDIHNLQHTHYDKIGNNLPKENINFTDENNTLQFYHLCSHSAWKQYVKDNINEFTEEQFLKLVELYIVEFKKIKLPENYSTIPLIKEFKKLYKSLL